MKFPLSSEQIAHVLGVPAANVCAYWPSIELCLDALGLESIACKIAALATIRVECPPFRPIHEYGSDALHEAEYGGRKDLGDLHPGDGAKFAGRGFIQITGELNYEHYGRLLGTDLVSKPDVALEPHVAAGILAAFFHEHGIGALADAGNWLAVRRKVNGGLNGFPEFLAWIQKLNQAIATASTFPG